MECTWSRDQCRQLRRHLQAKQLVYACKALLSRHARNYFFCCLCKTDICCTATRARPSVCLTVQQHSAAYAWQPGSSSRSLVHIPGYRYSVLLSMQYHACTCVLTKKTCWGTQPYRSSKHAGWQLCASNCLQAHAVKQAFKESILDA